VAGDVDDLAAAVPRRGPELLERLPGLDPVALGQYADGLLHADPGQQRVLQLADGSSQAPGLAGLLVAGGLAGQLAADAALLGGEEVGQDHGRGQVGDVIPADPPAVLGPPHDRVVRDRGHLTRAVQPGLGFWLQVLGFGDPVLARGHFTAASSLSRCLTWAADGLVMALPSGNTTVGTVWNPPLTDITKSAAAASSSMLISAISMPSRASWLLSRLQKAHHVVVYMVSGCAIGCSPSACRYELHITNTSERQVLPARTAASRDYEARAAPASVGERPDRR